MRYFHREGDLRWRNFKLAYLSAWMSGFSGWPLFGKIVRRRYKFLINSLKVFKYHFPFIKKIKTNLCSMFRRTIQVCNWSVVTANCLVSCNVLANLYLNIMANKEEWDPLKNKLNLIICDSLHLQSMVTWCKYWFVSSDLNFLQHLNFCFF